MYFSTNIDTLDAIMLAVGGMLSLVGSFMFLLKSFRAGLHWGCVVLFFFPIAAPIFMIYHWQTSKTSVAIAVLGYLLSSIALARTGIVDMPLPPTEGLREA